MYIYVFSRQFYPFNFCQYVCSLGIKPTTFCAANAMLYHWDTGTLLYFPYLNNWFDAFSKWNSFFLNQCIVELAYML